MPDSTNSVTEFQGVFFGLTIDGVDVGIFTGCSGLGFEINVAKMAQVSKEGKHLEVKVPGRHVFTPMTMKRGVTDNLALQKWFQDVVLGKGPSEIYKTIGVTVCDSMMEPHIEFLLDRCWPSKLSISDLNAASDEILVEEITIVYDRLDWK